MKLFEENDKGKVIPKKNKKITPPKDREPWFINSFGQSVTHSPMENKIARLLTEFKIPFLMEVSFRDLNPSGGANTHLRFDFYIPHRDLLIEYDGRRYHRTPEQKTRDKLKTTYCKKNGYVLMRLKAKHIPTLIQILSALV